MSTKLTTLALLKIMIIWNKGYDVMNSVDDVTSKILSRDSNYIAVVLMWPKFDSSSISMRDVIVISISRKEVFWGVLLVEVEQFGSGTKGCNLGANYNVCRSYRGKIGRGGIFRPSSYLNRVKFFPHIFTSVFIIVWNKVWMFFGLFNKLT